MPQLYQPLDALELIGYIYKIIIQLHQSLDALELMGFIGIERLDATIVRYHNCTTQVSIYIYIQNSDIGTQRA